MPLNLINYKIIQQLVSGNFRKIILLITHLLEFRSELHIMWSTVSKKTRVHTIYIKNKSTALLESL